MKANNYGNELQKLYDFHNQHIRVTKTFDMHDIDMLLTIVKALKLDEFTKLRWMEYSKDSIKATPPHSKLLKFLDLQARHFESALYEQKKKTTAHKSDVVVYHQL